MYITKYGHCCLLIDIEGTRILTDPGSFSTTQKEARDVDVILITHEHGDHLHVDSLREVLAEPTNSNAQIVTNISVMKILEKEGISKDATCHNVSHGESITLNGIKIEGFGTMHAEIYKEAGQVENTGYFIGEKLFYPGDAFYDPKRAVDVLALPVAGPWCKMKDVIEYALAVRPRVAFPVHDAVLSTPILGQVWPSKYLPEAGIEFVVLNAGDSKEF
jgi:L-ascorbate metabolism protein UlaG (beta-lactamase superfamily)